jgi:hypothetical protein
MKYIRIFLMILGLFVIATLFGEYVISRELNGATQLLGFVGMVGLVIYVGNETAKMLFNNKNKEEK